MPNVFDSESAADLLLLASVCATALGSLMIAAGLSAQRRLARKRA